MKCSIHRWNISRAFDSGEPLSRLTKWHLAHCEACREYCRLVEETGRRLSKDAASLLDDARPGLNEKLRLAIDESIEIPSPSLPHPARPWLKPVLAAVLFFAVVASGSIWMVRSRPAGMPRLDPLLKLETQKANLVSAMQRAESPYQEEISKLKKTFESTAEYLAGRFDTGLGEDKQKPDSREL
jgi:hypothetical protein